MIIVKTLLLWDIDCTLIDSGGAGERALRLALKRVYGIDDTLAWLEYFGRTDVWIARTILTHHQQPTTEANIQRFLDGYLKSVAEEMHNPRGLILPGVSSLLETIAASTDLAQGLLTGNLRRGAETKLGHFGLWKYFPFGAFADDAEQRDELGPYAVRRAKEFHAANFAPDHVVVIGDTPHDIACGKIIGARTIAVATGRYSVEQLRSHQPDTVFGTLADTKAFLASLPAA